MSATMRSSRNLMNPDEDFVLHGRSTPYWEKSGYPGNSSLTNTTSRLSQHALYNPDNYREKKYAEKKYATSLSDLANNLEYVSDRVDHTLSKGFIPVCDDHKESTKEPTETLSRPKLTMFDVTQPSLQESLRTDISEEELIKLYEEKIGKLDSISGRPVSPRDSQWYVNPNHLSTTGEAPTLQSIGQTFRNGEKIEQNYSDKDRIALNYFPVTLGSAYELCAEEFPEARLLLSTAPPSMRQSRSRSKQSRPRSKSATGLRRSQTFRDRFDEKQPVEKLYLTTAEAPCIGSSGVYMMSPYQTFLGKLRLERLQLEEAKLLELKRRAELERIRGPKPKWYASKGPDFHYESHKNTELIKCENQYQDLLDYREDLLRSSYQNLKKYTRGMD